MEDVIRITKTVAEYFDISFEDLCACTRKREVVVPRQMAHCLCYELTKRTLVQIGEVVGNKDHATVLYSFGKIKDLVDVYPDIRMIYLEIKNRCLAHPEDDAPIVCGGVAYSFYPNKYFAA